MRGAATFLTLVLLTTLPLAAAADPLDGVVRSDSLHVKDPLRGAIPANDHTTNLRVDPAYRYLHTAQTSTGPFTGTLTQTGPDGTALQAGGPLALDGDLRIVRTVRATPGNIQLHQTGTGPLAQLDMTGYSGALPATYLDVDLEGSLAALDPTQYTRIKFNVPTQEDKVRIDLSVDGSSTAPIVVYDNTGKVVAQLGASHFGGSTSVTTHTTGGLWTLTIKGPIAGTFQATVAPPEAY